MPVCTLEIGHREARGWSLHYRSPIADLETHRVENQPPPFENLNRYTGDQALIDAVRREGAGFAERTFVDLGERVGSAEVQDQAMQANRHPPELKAFDRFGRRIDEVEFHPAYHALMRLGLESGVSSIAWTSGSGGHAAHATLSYLMTAADAGVSRRRQWRAHDLAEPLAPRALRVRRSRGRRRHRAVSRDPGESLISRASPDQPSRSTAT